MATADISVGDTFDYIHGDRPQRRLRVAKVSKDKVTMEVKYPDEKKYTGSTEIGKHRLNTKNHFYLYRKGKKA